MSRLARSQCLCESDVSERVSERACAYLVCLALGRRYDKIERAAGARCYRRTSAKVVAGAKFGRLLWLLVVLCLKVRGRREG